MFMSIVQGPYYDRLVGSTSVGFFDLVMAGERVESGIKTGKIQTAAASSSKGKKPFGRFQEERGRLMICQHLEANASLIRHRTIRLLLWLLSKLTIFHQHLDNHNNNINRIMLPFHINRSRSCLTGTSILFSLLHTKICPIHFQTLIDLCFTFIMHSYG